MSCKCKCKCKSKCNPNPRPNQAWCYLNLGGFQKAERCGTDPALVSNNLKALFRRCQVLEEVRQYGDALKDAHLIQQLDPGNGKINEIIQRLKTLKNDERSDDGDANTQTIHSVTSEDMAKLKTFRQNADLKALDKKYRHLKDGILFGGKLLQTDPTNMEVRLCLYELHKAYGKLLLFVKKYFEAFIQMDSAAEVCQFLHPFVFNEFLPSILPEIVNSDMSNKDKKSIFTKQMARRNSDGFVEAQCGFHIAIVFAEKLRLDGEKEFNNELLKNLYLEYVNKLSASTIGFDNLAIQQAAKNSCRKALEYSNGKDFEVLQASALIFEQIGHLKEALKCCEEALQLNFTEELCSLHIQLKEELLESSDATSMRSDASSMSSVASSMASSSVSTNNSDSEVDEGYLAGTNIEQNDKVNKRKHDQLRKRKHKGKRHRPHRKPPQELSELEVESSQVNVNQADARSKLSVRPVLDKKQNESKKTARKPPRINSKRIFNLINEDYKIKLVCEGCWVRESKNGINSKFIYKFDKMHQCKQSKLLLQHRISGNVWLRIRSNLFYLSSKEENIELCEKEVILSGSCTNAKCKYPHSDAEKMVWQNCFKYNNWNVDALIFDLRYTYLRLMVLNVPENVEVFLGCNKCIVGNSYKTCRKLKRHKPECNNKHFWVVKTAVIMVKININGDNLNDFLYRLESNIPIPDVENENHIQEFISEVIQLLENKEFEPDKVVQQLDIKKKQQKKQMVKPAHINIKRVQNPSLFSNPRRRNNSFGSLTSLDEEADSSFDTDFSDIISNEDVEESKPQDKAHWEDSKYYNDKPLEILQNNLTENPDTFIKCSISLKGEQAARCYPVHVANSATDFAYIDIRGRMNCGKALHGDIVLVEKMDVEVLDSNEKVQRGRVHGVLLEKTNRKEYNFVCTLDGRSSDLMIPVTGKAPKIHIKNRQINIKDDKTRHTLVCIYENNGGRIEYLRRVSIKPKDRHNQLFLVKYEKWGNYMYPYGYVVKYIKSGKDLESGQTILDLMYQVPPKYDERICKYLKAMYDVDHASTRCDFRKEYVVSIHSPGCKEIDVALSVSQIPNSSGDACSMHRVGIHIADVTNYVKKDDSVDLDASKRRITFYPADRDKLATHMLPEILGSDICSFNENKERYSLSLFVDLLDNGQVCGKPKFKQTTIINKKQMTYTEAQLLIDGSGDSVDNKELLQTIVTLHKLTRVLRKNRLKNGFHQREMNISEDYNDEAEDAHALIEELMVLANTEAAKFIVEKYADKALILKQRAPNEKKVEEWLNKYQGNYPGFFSLSRFFADESLGTGNSFHILKSTFEQLKMSAEKEDIHGIIDSVRAEKFHPSFIVANSEWLAIQHPPCVSLYQPEEYNKHFTLQKDLYTWFTSPIHCYVDIIVHRMIKACIEDAKFTQCPYYTEELEDFCYKFNSTLRRQQEHQRAGNILKTALFFQKEPAYLPSVVTSFDEDGIQFDWATLPRLKNNMRTLHLRNFSLCDKPYLENNTQLDMSWEKRIYSASGKPVPFARSQTHSRAHSKEVIGVHSKSHMISLHSEKWNELISAIMKDSDDKTGYESNILILTADLINYAELKNRGDGFHTDITSEIKSENIKVKIENHHVKFKSTIETGYVSQLQLGCVITGGIIQPQINLYSVTPSVDICIEHMRDPIQCFSEIATFSQKDKYDSVQHYKQTWLPLMSMEATHCAITDGNSVIINEVLVELTKTKQSFYGFFELKPNFLKERKINLFANNKDESESELSEMDESDDYICLRIPLKSSARVLPAGRKDLSRHMSWRNVWSAHCVFNPMKCVVTEDKNIRVRFDVHKYTSEPPEFLIVEKGKIPSTVELFQKNLPHRRMEAVVNRFESATKICQSFILGSTFKEEDQLVDVTVPDYLDITVQDADSPLPRNNETQTKAIGTALQQNFTLIQGPPGTGKTLTGVKIGYWFNELNQKTQKCCNDPIHRQVLYCAQSNNAVDVAASHMQNRLAEKCPKIVRVYSELLEQEIFPLPGDVMVINKRRSRSYKMGGHPDLEKISLHHLIRKYPNPFAARILDYERQFQAMTLEEISDEQPEYKKLITEAALYELQQCDIIFCTTIVSGSPRMVTALNVNQCIIDECGMCTEPETLVPLVSHKPEQVVLIGDHKQLRPIVINSLARELGLEKSLFERQHNLINGREERASQSKARKRQDAVAEHRSQLGLQYEESQDEVKYTGFIMLDVQYRMHPEICAFPSKHFYDDKLKTDKRLYLRGALDQIWPNSKAPIAFCHVEGAEKSLTVASEEGSEKSKSNQLEVDEAVGIYMEFVSKLNISQTDIIILSQYNAQCNQIQKQLQDQRIVNANVNTVVASQGGEWDYVILSTVRSLPRYEIEKDPSPGWLKRNLGFIVDPHQINVALTRARKGLVIIGNQYLLRSDQNLWGKLLNHYEKKGVILGEKKFRVKRKKKNGRKN